MQEQADGGKQIRNRAGKPGIRQTKGNAGKCRTGEAGNGKRDDSGRGSAGLDRGWNQGKKVTEKVTDGTIYDTKHGN